ncbi:hypothetical protein [Acetobacter persici]|uniref:hypothetical protein n=1 Tax=Acetobacter persici TaxID=1076596 RepID=UPI001BADED7C|nr:hypothetical protein [Acetobacter persici]MBS1016989.1 hypothetical protein [Acetobacter persici]
MSFLPYPTIPQHTCNTPAPTRSRMPLRRSFTALAVSAGVLAAQPSISHAANWQHIIDHATGPSFGNEQGREPGRAATAADAALLIHTDNLRFSNGKFYPGDPKDSPSLDQAPRIVDVSFGPSLPHATVLIAHASYYGATDTYIAIVDAQGNLLWDDSAGSIQLLPTEFSGVHDFASSLSYPGSVINRWDPKLHKWKKLTSVGTPF